MGTPLLPGVFHRCICVCRHSRCADLLHSGWVKAGGGAAGVSMQQQEVQRANPAACRSSVRQSCGCVQVTAHLTDCVLFSCYLSTVILSLLIWFHKCLRLLVCVSSPAHWRTVSGICLLAVITTCCLFFIHLGANQISYFGDNRDWLIDWLTQLSAAWKYFNITCLH